LQTQTERISTDAATRAFQLKSTIITNEFESFSNGLIHAGLILDELKAVNALFANQSFIDKQLLSHAAVNRAWYAVRSKNSNSHHLIAEDQGAGVHLSPGKEQQKLMDRLLSQDVSSEIRSKITTLNGAQHWLMFSGRKLPDGSKVLLGIDIALKELQHYLQTFNTAGRASVFIVDENDTYITGPEEHLIGTKVRGRPTAGAVVTRLADSVTSYELTTSSFLQVPVIRYYTPLTVSGANWTMVVDTPMLVVDEEANLINQYVTVFFILTTFLILVLIGWSQTKWRQEFMLRQAVELKEKQLSIEKNELNLIAERQQKENVLLQLNILKQKVNPHFLFNSLSSLTALIGQDQDLAKSFVLKLSKVYRYVLES
jgi:hypothetical protein